MGAWIEIMGFTKQEDAETSHPTMGAWIEICDCLFTVIFF